MSRASIAIFAKKGEYSDNRTRPETPLEVFDAVQRVIDSKGCELVRSKTGLYVIQYSETGPGKEAMGWSDWLPVYVAKINEWSSGGIKKDEMEAHLHDRT